MEGEEGPLKLVQYRYLRIEPPKWRSSTFYHTVAIKNTNSIKYSLISDLRANQYICIYILVNVVWKWNRSVIMCLVSPRWCCSSIFVAPPQPAATNRSHSALHTATASLCYTYIQVYAILFTHIYTRFKDHSSFGGSKHVNFVYTRLRV